MRRGAPLPLLVLLAAALVCAVACGPTAADARDGREQRLRRLLDRRDELVTQVAALEAQIATSARAAPAPPSAGAASVADRSARLTQSADGAAQFLLCLHIYVLDGEISPGTPLVFQNEICQVLPIDDLPSDPAATIATLLERETFRCWMLAVPAEEVPPCWYRVAVASAGS
ncbi:MAG: hypothetical protein O3B31_01170 [Chloroflexi bacterium]|nr:hypothetical protein [Chloroflexota bacterium]MDA1001951.1 hypothetical protein [Chloroflexota bacterium]